MWLVTTVLVQLQSTQIVSTHFFLEAPFFLALVHSVLLVLCELLCLLLFLLPTKNSIPRVSVSAVLPPLCALFLTQCSQPLVLTLSLME